MSRLAYQSKHDGSYAVLWMPEGVQLGTVVKLVDGGWHATAADGSCDFAFALRRDAGTYLLHNATEHGCLPGCMCAEG